MRFLIALLDSLLQEAGLPVGHVSYRHMRGRKVAFRKQSDGSWIPVPDKETAAAPADDAETPVATPAPPPQAKKPLKRQTPLSSRFNILTDMAARQLFRKSMSVEDFEEALETPPGFEARLDELDRTTYEGHPALRMEISIWDKEGKSAGDATRYVYRNEEGELQAYHELFVVTQERQGIGDAMVRGAFRFYRKQGVKQVNLQASLSGGRYAWARLGFSDRQPGFFEQRVKPKFLNYLRNQQVSGEALAAADRAIQSPYDVARFAYQGERLGKEYMRSPAMPDWHAKMRLEDDDSGYQRAKKVLGLEE